MIRSITAATVLAAFAGVSAAQVTVYSSSFEGGDAAGFVGTGDWQLGIPTGFAGAPFGGPEPIGGNTGEWAWGTVIGGAHSASTVSSLSQTFDFSGLVDVQLSYFEWLDSGGNTFDTAKLFVNGDELLLADGGPTQWREVNVDLSAYDGLSSVTVDFVFSTTAVVERVGWYVDDVTITAIPAPASAALLGLGGLVATRRRR